MIDQSSTAKSVNLAEFLDLERPSPETVRLRPRLLGRVGSWPVRSGGGLVGRLVVGGVVLGLAGVADLGDVAGVAVNVVLDGLDAAVGEEDCNRKQIKIIINISLLALNERQVSLLINHLKVVSKALDTFILCGYIDEQS